MPEPIILFEDDSLIVIDKPAGLSVHADGRSPKSTLVDWLLPKYPELEGVGEEQTLESGVVIQRPGIVHRIDRETSGVLLVARTQESYENLKAQFHDREVQKTYRVFVYGNIKDDRGIIDKPIGSSRGGSGPRSVKAKSAHGLMRDALTTFRIIARSPEVSYAEVFPKTGRTHQIRVHFASLQRPVVCDRLYAPGRASLLGFKRLALHALSVTLTHPKTGKTVTFAAPLPADFVTAEAILSEQKQA
ncbi:MAG: RluA family pseudouridine synthase [bacterium]